MYNYKNILILEEWYKEVAKEKYTRYFNLNELLEEVTNQWETTGIDFFELSGYYTKTGVAKCYLFNITCEKNAEDEIESITFEF